MATDLLESLQQQIVPAAGAATLSHGCLVFSLAPEELMPTVRRLKEELEGRPAEELPLIVTHGLFLRFFLFDSLLGNRLGPADAPLLWRARSLNCGLSLFVRGESWHPADPEIPGWTCMTWMARTWDPPPLP